MNSRSNVAGVKFNVPRANSIKKEWLYLRMIQDPQRFAVSEETKLVGVNS